MMAFVKEILCCAVLCSAMLLTQSALGQALVPLSYIATTFGLEGMPGQQSWFISAFSLTVGTFVLPSGRLGDMYGHRLLLHIGFAWFALWELVSGLIGQYTTSYIGYDIVRALIGIGPAILLPNSIAILARLYPPKSTKKYVAFSLFAATAPIGCVSGALFATLLAQNPTLGWTWSCYIHAIVLVSTLLLSMFVVPTDQQVEEIVVKQYGASLPIKPTFDLWGTVLGVTGLVLFNFAFNQSIVVGWQEVYIYVLLLLGILFLAVFVFVEMRVEDPLIPLSVFTLRGSLILASLALGWSSFGTFLFYMVRFLQDLRHESALSSAIQLIPLAIVGIVAAFLSAHLLSRVNPSLVMFVALCCFCAGNALIAFQPIKQTFWIQTFLATLITPFGMDMTFPSASIIISDLLPPRQQGAAGSLVNTIVNYSIAFGLGLAGTVELQVNRGGKDLERGYRGALYLGIGFAVLGAGFALVHVFLDHFTSSSNEARVKDEEGSGSRQKIETNLLNVED